MRTLHAVAGEPTIDRERAERAAAELLDAPTAEVTDGSTRETPGGWFRQEFLSPTGRAV